MDGGADATADGLLARDAASPMAWADDSQRPLIMSLPQAEEGAGDEALRFHWRESCRCFFGGRMANE